MEYILQLNMKSGGESVQIYKTKKSALTAWDKLVDNTLPGDASYLKSVDPEGAISIMSSYMPFDNMGNQYDGFI